MLVLHLRTIAFVSSLSTAIQSVIWLVAYILYLLAYNCSIGSTNFTSHPAANASLPLNLGPYFIWYFQGTGCFTSTTWINATRGASATILVSLFSVGAVLNIVLLVLSVYTLRGLYTNLELHGRLLSYSITVYVVSLWDIILLAVVGKDFSPLQETKNYDPDGSDSTNPGVLALPYFTNVLVIVILLLSRFIFIWIFNVHNATFLIIKNVCNKNESNTSNATTLKHPAEHNSLRNETKEPPMWTQYDQDNKFWGLKATKDSPLSKWPIPGDQSENEPDEVTRRWNISRGRSIDASPPVSNLSRIEENERLQERRADPTFVSGSKSNEDIWKDMENHIRESDNKWRNSEFAFNSNLRRDESIRQSQSFNVNLRRDDPMRQSQIAVSNFHVPIRESFRRGPSEFAPQENPPEEIVPPQKPIDGFSYINDSDKKMDASEMFGIKLRHVKRPSIPNEHTEPEPEILTNEATPYAVTSISDIEPRNHNFDSHFFPPESKSTSAESDSSQQRKGLGAPPAPPLSTHSAKQSMGSVTFRGQMSLEEAIRTRRPLKPVNRPAIDTNC